MTEKKIKIGNKWVPYSRSLSTLERYLEKKHGKTLTELFADASIGEKLHRACCGLLSGVYDSDGKVCCASELIPHILAIEEAMK